MALQRRIEDYALIGDCRTGALVSKNGSIDWFCLPRFDSPACFASLLGDEGHGHWSIQPQEAFLTKRRYRGLSLVLETEFTAKSGSVLLTDAMLVGAPEPTLIRSVRGLKGKVPMHMDYVVRFDYGRLIPWIRKLPGGGIDAVAGCKISSDRSHPISLMGAT